jgi:uncharacterized protein (DUF2235 family)
MDHDSEFGDDAPTRELVLCFDGTGNTFRADGGESNILKIFRMLDRTKENRCMSILDPITECVLTANGIDCYYQRRYSAIISPFDDSD